MTLTRRAFLTSTATVTAAAVVGAIDAGAAEAAPRRRPLRRATFRPLVGRAMIATRDGRSTRIRLRRVSDVIGQRGSDHSFVLEFSSNVHLADGIYRIGSRRAGHHYLFMSAVNAPAQRRYLVVVNRTTR